MAHADELTVAAGDDAARAVHRLVGVAPDGLADHRMPGVDGGVALDGIQHREVRGREALHGFDREHGKPRVPPDMVARWL